MKYLFGILFPFLLVLSSCNTSKKIVYFQDAVIEQQIPLVDTNEIVIMPKDMISIIISSRDAQLAALFNLPRYSYALGSDILSDGVSSQVVGYAVDRDGNIEFPVLGTISVEGLTRKQLSIKIRDRLLHENLLKDPVVTIDFLNAQISVLGEVKNPGKYNIIRDQINILEAISLAGDLTIYGKRDGVLVIREQDGHRIIHKIDLLSSDVFSSPCYYLQQNDIVYVEPNSVRAGQSTINENNVKSVSLWMSIASLLATLGVLVFK